MDGYYFYRETELLLLSLSLLLIGANLNLLQKNRNTCVFPCKAYGVFEDTRKILIQRIN